MVFVTLVSGFLDTFSQWDVFISDSITFIMSAHLADKGDFLRPIPEVSFYYQSGDRVSGDNAQIIEGSITYDIMGGIKQAELSGGLHKTATDFSAAFIYKRK